MRYRIFIVTIFFLSIGGKAQRYAMGEIYDPFEKEIPLLSDNFSRGFSSLPLPDSFSLRKYCPRPGSQGFNIGSCVGWSIGYGAQTILWSVNNDVKDIDRITQEAFSGLYVYRSLKKQYQEACDKFGIDILVAAEFLKKNGNIPKKSLDDERICESQLPVPLPKSVVLSRISNYSKLFEEPSVLNGDFGKDVSKVNKTIEALADGLPVVFGIRIPKSPRFSIKEGTSFDDHKEFSNGVWVPSGNFPPLRDQGHAMVAVGYNKSEKYFEVLNSWGKWPQAGGDGYCKIRFIDFVKYVRIGVILMLDEGRLDSEKVNVNMQILEYERKNYDGQNISLLGATPLQHSEKFLSVSILKNNYFKIKLDGIPQGYEINIGSVAGNSAFINFPTRRESAINYIDKAEFVYPSKEEAIKVSSSEFYTLISITRDGQPDFMKGVSEMAADQSAGAFYEKIIKSFPASKIISINIANEKSANFEFNDKENVLIVLKVKSRK